MCGRVYEIYTAEDLSSRYLEGSPAEIDVSQTYNLCPTENSPVLLIADGDKRFLKMRWQLVPKTEPAFSTRLSTINARSESIFESRLYRDLVLRQRCIVPISGFYEWKREGAEKRPFRISLREESIMSVAGVWDTWHPGTKDESQSFSILTTSANEIMSTIHDRMPVILARRDEDVWLDPDFRDRESLSSILKPCPSSWLESAEVSRLVNSVKNNSSELLLPVESFTQSKPGARTLFDL